MCCFSRPVAQVSRTLIFARHTRPGWQGLVYSMSVVAKEPVAMVLPIPVKTGEAALRFIDLSAYPTLFKDLELLFPQPAARSMPAPAAAPQTLKVEKVGSFVASFAPSRADMARLDPQFRLPESAWKAMPKQYDSYGFAVFQLEVGAKNIHPMAFEFASAKPARLFFPTLHVHDGKVHESAEFDHTLFCQVPNALKDAATEWRRAGAPVKTAVDVARTQGLLAVDEPCFRARVYGHRPNVDTWVG